MVFLKLASIMTKKMTKRGSKSKAISKESELIQSLDAVKSNDFELFEEAKNKMGSYLPQL